MAVVSQFESSVNSEGIETRIASDRDHRWFESSVNSEGIETSYPVIWLANLFESSVNSEGIETPTSLQSRAMSLRAV